MYLYSNTSSGYRYGTFRPAREIPYGTSEYTMLYNKEEGYIDMFLEINCSPNPSFDIKGYLDDFAERTGRDIINYYEELMEDTTE